MAALLQHQAVVTSLQLFNKVMKAGRWSSGVVMVYFNSFYAVSCFLFGKPVSPSFLPSVLLGKEGSEGPPMGARTGEISCLWESHYVCCLGARTCRLPTLLTQILA